MNQDFIIQSSTAAYTSTVVLILWYFFFVLWRDYREQAFRQDLFELRSQLFDYARAGNISFDSPGYRNLEVTVNALIKYAYHVSFTTLVVAQIARTFSERDYGDGLQEKIETDQTLSQQQHDYLNDLHLKLIWASAWHIGATSLLAYPCFILLLLWARMTALFRVGVRSVRIDGSVLAEKYSRIDVDSFYLPPLMLRHLQYVENQAVESERKRVSRVWTPKEGQAGTV